MCAKIRRWLTPSRKWKIPVILLLGVFSGLGAYSIYTSLVWTYASDDPETCINCHIMAPQYASWNHSSHREVATCNDCHVPQDNLFRKYYFKGMDGLNHSTLFTLRAEREVIFIGNAGAEVVQENCIRCHTHLLDQAKLISQTEGKFQVHNTDRQCWECHKNVPHGRVRSLSSAPNAIVPVPESPVPDWLKSLTE